MLPKDDVEIGLPSTISSCQRADARQLNVAFGARLGLSYRLACFSGWWNALFSEPGSGSALLGGATLG
jgi:hypothetical protein